MVATSAATVYTGNLKFAYGTVGLPLVLLLAGWQRERAARQRQRLAFAALADRMESVYREESAVAVREGLAEAQRAGLFGASSAQIRRLEAKIGAMEGSVIASGAASRQAMASTVTLAQNVARSAQEGARMGSAAVARESLASLRTLTDQVVQMEDNVASSLSNIELSSSQQTESLSQLTLGVARVLGELDEFVSTSLQRQVGELALPEAASSSAMDVSPIVEARLSNEDIEALREMVRAEMVAGTERVGRETARAMAETAPDVAEVLAEDLIASIASSSATSALSSVSSTDHPPGGGLSAEQWSMLGARLTALEDAVTTGSRSRSHVRRQTSESTSYKTPDSLLDIMRAVQADIVALRDMVRVGEVLATAAESSSISDDATTVTTTSVSAAAISLEEVRRTVARLETMVGRLEQYAMTEEVEETRTSATIATEATATTDTKRTVQGNQTQFLTDMESDNDVAALELGSESDAGSGSGSVGGDIPISMWIEEDERSPAAAAAAARLQREERAMQEMMEAEAMIRERERQGREEKEMEVVDHKRVVAEEEDEEMKEEEEMTENQMEAETDTPAFERERRYEAVAETEAETEAAATPPPIDLSLDRTPTDPTPPPPVSVSTTNSRT